MYNKVNKSWFLCVTSNKKLQNKDNNNKCTYPSKLKGLICLHGNQYGLSNTLLTL